jgi:hypothetical protein
MKYCLLVPSLSILLCGRLHASAIVKVMAPPPTAESTPCPSIAPGAICTTTPYIQTTTITGTDVILNKTDSAPRVGAGIPYPAQNNLFYEAWNAWDDTPANKGSGGNS